MHQLAKNKKIIAATTVAAIFGFGFLSGVLLPRAAIAQIVPPRVAVFSEPNFSTYGFSASVTPQLIARDLRATGVAVELLNADALTQPGRFNAKRFAALVLPYGNAYPQEAFANLRRFHQAGGSLITTGIPFTHPAERIAAHSWSAMPSWGAAVRRVEKVTAPLVPSRTALQIIGDPDRRVGASSARFPVRPGVVTAASALIRETGIGRKREADAKRDELLVRFFDAQGNFLKQEGETLPLSPTAMWKKIEIRCVAPEGAVLADVSLQVQQAGRRYLATRFEASVDSRSVNLPNADLSERDPNVWNDRGHTNAPGRWGLDGIGVGGFAGPEPAASVSIPAADPWRLKGVVAPAPAPRPAPQWIDVRSLPAGVRVIPALGNAARPLAALLVQVTGPFAGAVDAWTLRGFSPDRDDYETRQIIARATIAVLARRKRFDSRQQAAAFLRLDNLPRPTRYADLTLPIVARKYPTLQPKTPAPAPYLLVADVRTLSADERLLLISLQGIVNRAKPRIYLVFDEDDRLWLDELQKRKVIEATIPVPDPWSLLTTFRNEYTGAVVCDPKIYDSPCVAVALAGAENALIAKTPELAARLNLPVTIDLRGKFHSNADALRYVRTDVLPRLDPYLTCSLDPERYDKGALDQIIAARGSAFWITGPKTQNLPGADQEAELAEVRRFLSALPLGAVVRGFWWNGDGKGLDEEAGVALGSRFGKVTLVSDLITNLSVHSGVKADNLKQKPRPPAPPLDKKKVYLSFTMSDGDNLCTWRGYFRRYFADPARGSVPVGWGMGPAIIDLAPDWAKWYYEAATPNDEFICDVSGAAYLYPPDWGLALKNREAALRQFYDLTQIYMNRMDMKTIRLMNVNADSIKQVGALLPGVDFLMPDYGHAGGRRYADLTYTIPTGQSVFRAVTSGSGPENLAAQIRSRAGKTRPAFVNAFIWNWGASLSDLKRTLELLGPDYVAVLPSQLDTLYRRAAQRNPRKP